jgi:putative protease
MLEKVGICFAAPFSMTIDRCPATASSPLPLRSPELLAPAGSWDCAKAAVENGADAIYFGLERFNARMRAHNFTEADLPELMAFLHRRGVKGYVTFNTLVFAEELAAAEQYLQTIIAAGVDAAIVQDVGMCRLIRHLSPDFPIHASTQMTITSGAGVAFARSLGCNLVVLARECSLKEIHTIQQQIRDRSLALPLEVFVHGALCVAYSGQCLTSEALGGRSANRGECAQACRMPYELVVNGERLDLGDRKYLLSPQDLAGLDVLPQLIQTGVTSLKIEGRLKTPEYVASVTRTYRQAIDRVSQGLEHSVTDPERYRLEMAFSRGLHTGWLQGINNQALVHAQFGKKRGVYLGKVTRIHDARDKQVSLHLQAPLKAGDGVVFDSGHPQADEEGGRVYAIEQRGQEAVLTFGRRDVDLRRVNVGDRLWKTSDPELDRQLRQSFTSEHPQFQRPITIEVHGAVGQPLTAIVRDNLGHVAQAASTMPLVEAHTQQLTGDRLQAQFGRLGNTPFRLASLTSHLQGAVLLPVSELNRLRRQLVTQLEQLRAQPKRWQLHTAAAFSDLLPPPTSATSAPVTPASPAASHSVQPAELIVLVRHFKQLEAALQAGIQTLYCEFEDPRAYRRAVQQVRQSQTSAVIYVAPPRITKPGETYILQQVRSCDADGYLVRNYDHLEFFANARCVGDFSLNIANSIAANYFKQSYPLERLTASYDLNVSQLAALLAHCPADWFEVTLHQHMPMFHMEHCVFCAFLSEGTDYTNCGRPCEQHDVKLRDRTGTEHVLQADAGCRNTVFNGTAQTGAESVQHLLNLGMRHFRLEFVNETPEQVSQTIDRYQQLLQGNITGSQLWRTLKLQNQLGVTRGSIA